jgi:hypothetical protein
MEDLLDLELSGVLKVRTGTSDFGKDLTVIIGDTTDRFCSAGIDSKDRAHPCQRIALTAVNGSGTFGV